ncbi:MAG TPA: hypothetical protein VGF06_12775 [Terriglobales bacterium]|jgi:hypothetical protein
MIARLKKRWLRPRMLGVLIAKLILSGATGMAGQPAPVAVRPDCPAALFSCPKK